MNSILFEIKNKKEPVEITFEEKCGLLQPILKTTEKTDSIPLLLDSHQAESTLKKLRHVKIIKGSLGSVELLRDVVAGAASMSIKKF